MKKNIILTIFVALFCLNTRIAFASDISFKSNKSEVNLGEQFVVDVVVNSTDVLNAVEGSVNYSFENVDINGIIYKDSVINFWIERPKANKGNIIFSGVTPVGFSGLGSKIFSIVLTAKKAGPIDFYFVNSKGYLNDGKGTEIKFDLISGAVKAKGDIQASSEMIEDNDPPEDFTPTIVSDINSNDGKSTLIFYTQDKNTGMKEYFVKEGFLSFYRRAESPYLLRDQSLSKDIYIKAVDNNGNDRVVILSKGAGSKKLYYYIIQVAALISVLCVLWIKLRKKY